MGVLFDDAEGGIWLASSHSKMVMTLMPVNMPRLPPTVPSSPAIEIPGTLMVCGTPRPGGIRQGDRVQAQPAAAAPASAVIARPRRVQNEELGICLQAANQKEPFGCFPMKGDSIRE